MIESAACRAIINNNETVVIKCHRHCDFYETMKLLHINYRKASVEQGFIDWDGHNETFLDRLEAFKKAQVCGQIDKKMPLQELYSEMLW